MASISALSPEDDTPEGAPALLPAVLDLPASEVPVRPGVPVLGVHVDLTTSEEVLGRLEASDAIAPQHLVFVNAHSLNLASVDGAFHEVISRADVVLNDGIGLSLAARMRGVEFSENLNGSDLTGRILELAAQKGWSAFFYGAEPGVAEAAAVNLQDSIPGLRIAGTLNGFSGLDGDEAAAFIHRSKADVLIVALGQPRQEMWLDRHLAQTGCRLGLGVGAFLDFSAGRVPRAPAWMNQAGIEWAYRLSQEPGRLWKRYIVGNPLFLWRAWRSRRNEAVPSLASGRRDATGARELTVSHFGPNIDEVGGMGSVIRSLRDARIGADRVQVHPSWSASTLRTLGFWVRSLGSVALGRQVGVVHAHLSEGGSFIREGSLLLLGRLRGRPTVATLHGAQFSDFATRHPRLVRGILGRIGAVICLVPAQRDYVRSIAPGTEVLYVPNPVIIDPEPSPAGQQPPTVLFAGEIGLRKGADVLLEAWPLVRAAVPDARCQIIGPPTELEVGEQPGLSVHPSRSAAEIRQSIRESRCVALPSRAEAMPMFLLEAMGSARPFVSTPVGAIAELSAGGVLVPTDDPQALADALIDLLSDPERADELGMAGHASCAATRSDAVVGEALRTVYARLSLPSRWRKRKSTPAAVPAGVALEGLPD